MKLRYGREASEFFLLPKAPALTAHAAVLKSLADTLKTVIGLEREAFDVSAATSEPAAVGLG